MKVRIKDGIVEVSTYCDECHKHINAKVDSIELGRSVVRLNFGCRLGHYLNEEMSRDNWEKLEVK